MTHCPYRLTNCKCSVKPEPETFPWLRVQVTLAASDRASWRTVERVLSVRTAEGGELVLERTEGRVLVLAKGWRDYQTFPDNERLEGLREIERERKRQEREDREFARLNQDNLRFTRGLRAGRGYGL